MLPSSFGYFVTNEREINELLEIVTMDVMNVSHNPRCECETCNVVYKAMTKMCFVSEDGSNFLVTSYFGTSYNVNLILSFILV